MPPPSSCSKISTRSTGDHEPENDCDGKNSKTNTTVSEKINSDEERRVNKCEGVGIVKSILGPSFEDAVLRTLEFGKSLIQKPSELEPQNKEKKDQMKTKRRNQKKSQNRTPDVMRSEETRCLDVKKVGKRSPDGGSTRKRIVFTAKLEKEWPPLNKIPSGKKLNHVAKIRSLDSDLKQVAPSPEKIKRQLEALIQINRDEPPEHLTNWAVMQKSPQLPVELTVMPNVCMYRNELDFNCPSSCEVSSLRRQNVNDEEGSTSRFRNKKRLGNTPGLCQAPEFLSNALGPTLDVSIIENLKMMRDLFKCESGTGEGIPKDHASLEKQSETVDDKKSSEELQKRIEELQERVKELEEKEQMLIKQAEEEMRKRDIIELAKISLAECPKEGSHRSLTSCKSAESKLDELQKKITCNEEKLKWLKSQIESSKKELGDVKNQQEALKRNKSLLDAWDVFASRACHTRLPSFSRVLRLERKQLKENANLANLHCCFSDPEDDMKRSPKSSAKKGSASRNGSRHESPVRINDHTADASQLSLKANKMRQEIPFPIQRDIICGMHDIQKRCNCKGDGKAEDLAHSSDEELVKKCGTMRESKNRGEKKHICRSRSETAVKRDRGAKIVKVMWAVTRINIFQDNCRTYEVMDATSTPPAYAPARTEGIFVVKNPEKKNYPTRNPPRKTPHYRGKG